MALDVTSNADAHFSSECSPGPFRAESSKSKARVMLVLTGTHWKLLYGGVRLVPCRTRAVGCDCCCDIKLALTRRS